MLPRHARLFTGAGAVQPSDPFGAPPHPRPPPQLGSAWRASAWRRGVGSPAHAAVAAELLPSLPDDCIAIINDYLQPTHHDCFQPRLDTRHNWQQQQQLSLAAAAAASSRAQPAAASAASDSLPLSLRVSDADWSYLDRNCPPTAAEADDLHDSTFDARWTAACGGDPTPDRMAAQHALEHAQRCSGPFALDASLPVLMSKFGGCAPYLPAGSEWPVCSNRHGASCLGRPMHFVFQVFADDLPDAVGDLLKSKQPGEGQRQGQAQSGQAEAAAADAASELSVASPSTSAAPPAMASSEADAADAHGMSSSSSSGRVMLQFFTCIVGGQFMTCWGSNVVRAVFAPATVTDAGPGPTSPSASAVVESTAQADLARARVAALSSTGAQLDSSAFTRPFKERALVGWTRKGQCRGHWRWERHNAVQCSTMQCTQCSGSAGGIGKRTEAHEKHCSV